MSPESIPHSFVVNKSGCPEAVLFSFTHYKKLMRLIEDLSDAVTLKKAIRSSRGTFSHQEILARLQQQKLL